MTTNLINPITKLLEIGQLAGPEDTCYQNRTGYEVQVDSMGIMKRGQVVRVLERHYDARSGIRETRVIRPFS